MKKSWLDVSSFWKNRILLFKKLSLASAFLVLISINAVAGVNSPLSGGERLTIVSE